MFNRIRFITYFTGAVNEQVISQKSYGSSMPLHGATKTSREMAIGSQHTIELKPNHLGLGFILSSTNKCKVTMQRSNPLETQALTVSTGNYHLFHSKRSMEDRLNTSNTYQLIIENVSGEVIKFACHYT